MRSEIQSGHQMTIIHSDIAPCWPPVTAPYLFPGPFNTLYIAPIFMTGKMVERLLKGGDNLASAAWRGFHFFYFIFFSPTFPFPLEEIETFHLGKIGCNKSEIAADCPLNVVWIEIQDMPAKAVRP